MIARPTAHAEDCISVGGLVEVPTGDLCTCALAERQRIFDLERRVEELEAELEAAKDEAQVAAELADD